MEGTGQGLIGAYSPAFPHETKTLIRGCFLDQLPDHFHRRLNTGWKTFSHDFSNQPIHGSHILVGWDQYHRSPVSVWIERAGFNHCRGFPEQVWQGFRPHAAKGRR
jgi:hypothetical protein